MTGKLKRQASVYDAVAGRISSSGFIPVKPTTSKNRDTPSSNVAPAPPEEVLFRRRGAPIRYEEDDFYWADRSLKSQRNLPESDLLKAVHEYASDFYSHATIDKGRGDFESMDETALIATAVLLEEATKNTLGKTGHLAFVEAEEERGLTGGEFGSEYEAQNKRSSCVTIEPKTRSYDGSEKKRRKLA